MVAANNQEAHAHIRNQLRGKSVQIFDALSDGRARPVPFLAVEVGYIGIQSRAFCQALRTMVAMGIIKYLPRTEENIKMVQLTDFAFPDGRSAVDNNEL